MKNTSLVLAVPLAGPNYFFCRFRLKASQRIIVRRANFFLFLEYLILHCAILAREKVLISLFLLEK